MTFIFILIQAWMMLGTHADPPANYSLHKVKVHAGEGAIMLLNRYELGGQTCNLDAFYRLNKLDKNSNLKRDKEYTLPVYIYEYNGKSIRSTLGIDDWATAVRIKDYNETIQAKNLRKTHYIDSKILWVPHHELKCQSKEVEETIVEKQAVANTKRTNKNKNYRIEKIFGDKYSKVEVVDKALSGHVYYIVSGHGGPDPGAVCKECSERLCEDEYAYDVSLRLARDLMQHGATVEIIIQDPNDGIRDSKIFKCDHDERSYSGQKLKDTPLKRLNQRSADINVLYRKHAKKGVKSQQAVFIHVDSYAKSSLRRDVFFYHHSTSKLGKKLARNIQKTFKKKYDKYQKNRGYKGHVSTRDGLFVLRRTQPACVFIELANIQNPADQKRILLDTNRQALANWIFEGLTLNIKKS